MKKNPHTSLLQWYKTHGRHELPWRKTNNLYHIYLSEVMLQQTQVERVKNEYYPQFLEQFPTLKTLANAPLDAVLGAWSGLGYYRRAKNLHAAAKACEGVLPTTYKELLALPGIGAYTASAICSFGLHQAVPVVDTNIARVLKRHFALLGASEKKVWSTAEAFLNTQESRAHNLALMDLGSMVCLPKNPKCNICPLASTCQGKEDAHLYTKTAKKESIAMDLFFGVCIQNGKIALHPSKENMYKDMLVLPSTDPIEEHFIGSFKHAYTKYRLTVHLYKVEEVKDEDIVWLALEDLENAPISSLTKKAISKI